MLPETTQLCPGENATGDLPEESHLDYIIVLVALYVSPIPSNVATSLTWSRIRGLSFSTRTSLSLFSGNLARENFQVMVRGAYSRVVLSYQGGLEHSGGPGRLSRRLYPTQPFGHYSHIIESLLHVELTKASEPTRLSWLEAGNESTRAPRKS